MNVKIVLVVLIFLGSCHEQENNCTDSLANNFDSTAVINDGSCTYDAVSVSPVRSLELNDLVSKTSGLIFWDNLLWTQNDHFETSLYGIDPQTALVTKEFELDEVVNTDWEEIQQDSDYIYIGDFGNNESGNREDLHLLRVGKNSLKEESPEIDTIWYSYSDQTDFSTVDNSLTDFDCEAFIVSDDSIYFYTKQWISVLKLSEEELIGRVSEIFPEYSSSNEKYSSANSSKGNSGKETISEFSYPD